MRIGAGIYHYRHWPEVRTAIDSLLAQTRKPDEIVVLDHASGDGSADELRAAYPDIEVVETPDNRGQVAGENRIRRVLLERGFDAVYTAPDDLELAPDAMEQLAARLEEDPGVGAVGPLIANPHDRDRIFYAGGYVRRHNWSLEFRDQPPRLSDWHDRPPQAADFLQSGGMLMRSEVARQVGDSCEKFWYWSEDIDYALRIGKLGWRVECVPAAVGWQSFGDPPPYIETRNHLMLIARNAPKRFVVRELVRRVYWLGRHAISPPDGSRDDLLPRMRGVVDFCLGRGGPPPASVSRDRSRIWRP
jgi:GT2 family glycosyltransferase